MKSGRSLQDLAAELERQVDSKEDYLVPTQQMHMDDRASVNFEHPETHEIVNLPVNDYAHRQIGTKIGIPAKYYDKMRDEAPHLLARNVNHWFKNEPEQRLVRSLDNRCRAFLSESYRRLDNFDLAEAILPTLLESGAKVESCEITERKMYIKAVIPGRKEEIGPPEGWEWGKGHNQIDVVQPGIVVSNSEIGSGALAVAPAVHTVHCSNLAVWNDSSLKKVHLGEKLSKGLGDDIAQYFTEETKSKTDEALWYQVRDLVQGALLGQVFTDIVDQLREAREFPIEGKIVDAVEVLAKNKRLAEDESEGILEYLQRGGEFSKYGLHAATTRYAEDVNDYDRATELEQLGAEIITLPRHAWEVISKAA